MSNPNTDPYIGEDLPRICEDVSLTPEFLAEVMEVEGREYRRHPNGGGFIGPETTVDGTAYVGPHACVHDHGKVLGDARLEGESMVMDQAEINGSAVVKGGAWVIDRARITGAAHISGKITVDGESVIGGKTIISPR